jgi:hypothetical protein
MLTRLLFMPLADGKGRAMSQRGRNNTVPNFAEHAAFQLVLQQLKDLHLHTTICAHLERVLKVSVA